MCVCVCAHCTAFVCISVCVADVNDASLPSFLNQRRIRLHKSIEVAYGELMALLKNEEMQGVDISADCTLKHHVCI